MANKNKKRTIWINGFDDGSGKGTIVFGDKPVLRVHWGCSCCDSFDKYNPSKEDKKLIRLADKIVEILNKSGFRPKKIR